MTVHVMVPSTGLRPVDATPWASPRGGLEGGGVSKSMFLSTSRSYQITSFTLPISTRCQV